MLALQQTAIKRFHTMLHRWYQKHGRKDLPWRNTPDPYAIWLSEVMLQQTQVSTVLARYYHPFLEKFPSVQALAAADRQAVMKAWEGLGYYRRAGFLHDAAKKLAEAGGWKHFNTVESLQTLPGIGRNTAHAIASFGFSRPVPVMEANLKRVLARIHAVETPTENQLWDMAHQLMDEEHPFDYNQAMMDIGATICTPRKPACILCPARTICEGKAEPERYPQKKAKKETPTRERLLVAAQLMRNGEAHYYLEPREGSLLGGLWGFPQLELDAKYVMLDGKKKPLDDAQKLLALVHVYSHFRLEAQPVLLPVKLNTPGNQWFTLAQIKELPLSGVDRKMLQLLSKT